MKTVAQWAEQLPELIKIEFLKVNNKMIYENFKYLYNAIKLTNCPRSKFWCGVYENALIDPTSADYIDETIPYTKEEVEAMILEFADQNDEVCKVMLANVASKGTRKVKCNRNDLLDEIVCMPSVNVDLLKRLPLFPTQNKDNIGELDKFHHWEEAPKEEQTDLITKSIYKTPERLLKRVDELVSANSTLVNNNEELKREVEANEARIQRMSDLINKQSDEKKALKADILYLEETIRLQEETIKTLTQMATPAPKKEQSIFFDLLEHLNIIKK